MTDLLVAARIIHFASTATVAGAILFRWVVVEPAFRQLRAGDTSAQAELRDLQRVVWLSLALALASGALWVIAVAKIIGGDVSVVLIATSFGRVWLVRLVLAALVLLCELLRSKVPSAIAAACLMGSLAWSGHAAGTPAILGDVHRAADVLHLIAAAAWLGGLLPLGLLLRRSLQTDGEPVALAVASATRRFSTLGIVAVMTLLGTGLVNAWTLVGDPKALLDTRYGQLLLLKVMLFLTMVAIAAYNRGSLTPRLPEAVAMGQLARNAFAEAGLGLAILVIVSVLGVLPPVSHMDMPGH